MRPRDELPVPKLLTYLSFGADVTIKGKLIIAEKYTHMVYDGKLQDLEGDDYGNCLFSINRLEIPSPDLGSSYVGNFVTGLGLCDVIVPVKYSRKATAEEIECLTKLVLIMPWGRYKLNAEEFL